MRGPHGRRIFFADNFFTRKAIGRALFVLTDGEIRFFGTIRVTDLSGKDGVIVKRFVGLMRDFEHGSWLRCQFFEKELAQQRTRGRLSTKTMVEDIYKVAENSGYIFFRDHDVVIPYSNDLVGTPRQELEGYREYTLHAVHGLPGLERWTGNGALHRTKQQFSALIVAYNAFMNWVDSLDQLRSSNPTM